MDWMEHLAGTIIANWSKWEEEAGRISQTHESPDVGEEFLREKLVHTIKDAWSKHVIWLAKKNDCGC